MGEDAPEAVVLTCPGCETQFRLKPKKGRLPEGPVTCPKCATDIPVVEGNLSEPSEADPDSDKETAFSAGGPVPQAAAFNGDADSIVAADGSGERQATSDEARDDGQPGDDEQPLEEDEHSFSDINISEASNERTGPKQTFLGVGPGTLKSIGQDESSVTGPDEPTQLVDRDALGRLRENSAAESSDPAFDFSDSSTSGRLRRPSRLDEESAASDDPSRRETSEQESAANHELRETAENNAYTQSDEGESFDEEIEESLEADSNDVDETSPPPSVDDEQDSVEKGSTTDDQNGRDEEGDTSTRKGVLAKLKLKKKLASRIAKDKAEEEAASKAAEAQETAGANAAGDDEPAASNDDASDPADETEAADQPDRTSNDQITLDREDQKTGEKPSLSALLKKARKKSQGKTGLPRPRQSTTQNKRPKPTGEKLDKELQNIANATAQALSDEEARDAEGDGTERTTEKLGQVAGTERLGKVSGPDEAGKKRSSKEMMDLLRRKVAEKDQPGAASERRGSGYIRLPTAEIQDVLGQGTYRLRVEDIVYEPVDKEGLTKLIKRGVLMGAAEIAKGDGDWMPVQEHPVFHELRRKMAREAHDLLADYRADAESEQAPETPDTPEHADDSRLDEPTDLLDQEMLGGIPTMEAELEETPTEDKPDQPDSDEDAEKEAPAAPEPADESGETLELPRSDASLEFPPELSDETEAGDDRQADAPAKTPPGEQGRAAEAGEQALEGDKDTAPSPEPDSAGDDRDIAEATEADLKPADAASAEPELEKDASGEHEYGTPPSYPAIDPSKGPEESEVIEDAEAVFAPPAPNGKRRLIIVLSIATALAVIAAIAVSPIGRPHLEKVVGPINLGSDEGSATEDRTTTTDTDSPESPAGQPPDVSAAISEAKPGVESAIPDDMTSADTIRAMAKRRADDADASSAADLLAAVRSAQPGDTAMAKQHADLLIDADRHTDARHVLARAIAAGADSDTLSAIFQKATADDPGLGGYDVVQIRKGEQANAFRAYDKWEGMTFQLTDGDEVVGLFKPSQKGWVDGWRDEIAAWRLCELMTCHFQIPENRPAKVTRAEMEKLVKSGSSDAQERYRNQLETLIWTTEKTDAGEVEVVYGTLKDWPGEWAPFPIEYTDAWRPWLSIPGADLDKPAEVALQELTALGGESQFRSLISELEGATTRRLSRELSSILVFDFLTNNWDRFVDEEDRYGVNNPFADGHFVSLNNPSVFQTRDSTRVKGRFQWTSRFSRSTIASLRLLDPSFVSEALYPNADALSRQKLDVFWTQRERALERVDELGNARGQDAVMAFD